jgi:hypothetical protein
MMDTANLCLSAIRKQRLSDPNITLAKAQRRQVQKKTLPVHKQMYFLFSDLCALATLREIFRFIFLRPLRPLRLNIPIPNLQGSI